MSVFLNPHHDSGWRPDGATGSLLDSGSAEQASRLLAQCFACGPTRLVALTELAGRAGVASIHAKDEGARLGLTSFKALGGAYALIREVLDEASRQLGRTVTAAELPRAASGSLALPGPGLQDSGGAEDVAKVAATMTFGCATDGNHGQSVAAGARLVGARAVIFVHEGVSAERRQAIARFGAEIVVVPGNYDDAVAESVRQCEARGWTLLSDTSWDGYTRTPLRVMQGYTAIVDELRGQPGPVPTHVFLQAGVGGFAAAIAACLRSVHGAAAPQVVVVEPARAACFMASARAGRSLKIEPEEPTVMAMLECYEPSQVAWELLKPATAAFVAIDEGDALDAMRLLAQPRSDDEVIVAGESGGAGLAGLLAVCRDADARRALALGPESRVLLVITESATDAARYQAAVGATPAQIGARTVRPRAK